MVAEFDLVAATGLLRPVYAAVAGGALVPVRGRQVRRQLSPSEGATASGLVQKCRRESELPGAGATSLLGEGFRASSASTPQSAGAFRQWAQRSTMRV